MSGEAGETHSHPTDRETAGSAGRRDRLDDVAVLCNRDGPDGGDIVATRQQESDETASRHHTC